MIVVDSSVWIDYLRAIDGPNVLTLRREIPGGSIVVGDIVLLEVLQGARDDAHAARLEKSLRQFRLQSMLDDSVAVEAARLYRLLRGEGITIRKSNDLLIAAFCLRHGHRLLHQDRDFWPFEQRFGLNVM